MAHCAHKHYRALANLLKSIIVLVLYRINLKVASLLYYLFTRIKIYIGKLRLSIKLSTQSLQKLEYSFIKTEPLQSHLAIVYYTRYLNVSFLLNTTVKNDLSLPRDMHKSGYNSIGDRGSSISITIH